MSTSAGYSGTPLAKKPGIKDGSRVTLVDAPDGFETSHRDALVPTSWLNGATPRR